MWKKRNTIEGVSSSSSVGLQAEVHKLKLQSKLKQEGTNNPTSKKQTNRGKLKEPANKGVEARNARDLDSRGNRFVQATDEEPDWEHQQRRLIEKSSQYNNLKHEHNYDQWESLYNNEKCMVDFERKFIDLKKLKQESSSHERDSDESNSEDEKNSYSRTNSYHLSSRYNNNTSKPNTNTKNLFSVSQMLDQGSHTSRASPVKGQTADDFKKQEKIKMAFDMTDETIVARQHLQDVKERRQRERNARLQQIQSLSK